MGDQENRRGIRGWVKPYPYGASRWAYTFQRITGVALFFYLAGHVIVTAEISSGEEAWNAQLALLESPLGHFVLLAVIASLTFHAANGTRLIFSELGYAVGKPRIPEYPYRSAPELRAQIASIAASILLALMALFYAWAIISGG